MSRSSFASRHVAIVLIVLAVIAAADSQLSAAQTADDAQTLSAQSAIVLLRDNCQRCHNARELLGGLDLTSREAMLRGGDSGPAVLLSDPPESLLLSRLREGSMPPINDGDPVPAPDIERLQAWIAAGLTWPTTAQSAELCPDTSSQRSPRRGLLRRLFLRLRSAKPNTAR